jgi:hypothetical protein
MLRKKTTNLRGGASESCTVLGLVEGKAVIHKGRLGVATEIKELSETRDAKITYDPPPVGTVFTDRDKRQGTVIGVKPNESPVRLQVRYDDGNKEWKSLPPKVTYDKLDKLKIADSPDRDCSFTPGSPDTCGKGCYYRTGSPIPVVGPGTGQAMAGRYQDAYDESGTKRDAEESAEEMAKLLGTFSLNAIAPKLDILEVWSVQRLMDMFWLDGVPKEAKINSLKLTPDKKEKFIEMLEFLSAPAPSPALAPASAEAAPDMGAAGT